jgi:hypothetical protein
LDDVEQEFYLYLRDDGCRRLRTFRGEGEAEFRSFIDVVARNFLRSQWSVQRRDRARESRTWPIAARPEVERATEPQVLAAFREFVATSTIAERGRLAAILALEERQKATPVGSRTLRRWRRELAILYVDRVL